MSTIAMWKRRGKKNGPIFCTRNLKGKRKRSMNNDMNANKEVQPKSYTEAELSKLREFVDVLKKDESRSSLACWGNYDDYNHGY